MKESQMIKVGVRIPPEWEKEIERLAKHLKISKSDALRFAIESYLVQARHFVPHPALPGTEARLAASAI